MHPPESWTELELGGHQVFDAAPDHDLPAVRLELHSCDCATTLSTKLGA